MTLATRAHSRFEAAQLASGRECPRAASRIVVALTCCALCRGQSGLCRPNAEITAELQEVAHIRIADASATDQNIAPFLALRERRPGDLFVHEAYQDAVQRHGIEGHLRESGSARAPPLEQRSSGGTVSTIDTIHLRQGHL